MESMQASLEVESRAKAEALRIKKKLEADINELEIALDHANKANAEAHKGIKRFQGQLRDVEGLYEDESRQRRELSEKAGLADRRANALHGELEGSIHSMHAEIDDMLAQAKSYEEKAKKAMIDAARLADELRAEQEHSSSQEKAKRALESQITELEQRLAEANDVAAKGGLKFGHGIA